MLVSIGVLFVLSFHRSNQNGGRGRHVLVPGVLASSESFPRRFPFRGGESSRADDIEQFVADQDENATTAKEEKSEVLVENSTSSKGVSLSAPFRMNAVVQEEAACVEEGATSTSGENESETKQITRGVLVGGAATMVKDKPVSSSRLGPLDISRASPLSSRLIEEEPSEAIQDRATGDTTAAAPNNITDVAKLWWVNVWTQQLADLDNPEERIDDDNFSIGSEDKNAEVAVVKETEKLEDTTQFPVDKFQKTREKSEESGQETSTSSENAKQEERRSMLEGGSDAKEAIDIHDRSYVSSGLVSVLFSISRGKPFLSI
jgi:hypothetical protein